MPPTRRFQLFLDPQHKRAPKSKILARRAQCCGRACVSLRKDCEITMDDNTLREHLAKVLGWNEAHVDWKTALEGLPAKHPGAQPPGAPHSAWEFLEPARIAQWDILEFCRNPKHVSPDFPAGYWPKTAAPPNPAAWDKSVNAFERDLREMQKLVSD